MPKNNDGAKTAVVIEAIDGCQWCEAAFDDQRRPKLYLIGASAKRAFCGDECLETFDDHHFTELSCTYCNRELSGPGSINYQEKPDSYDGRIVRQFCSNECCQKYRLGSMQSQRRSSIASQDQSIRSNGSSSKSGTTTTTQPAAPTGQPLPIKQTARKHSIKSNSSRTSTDSDNSKGPRKTITSSTAINSGSRRPSIIEVTGSGNAASTANGHGELKSDQSKTNNSSSNHSSAIEASPQKAKKALKRSHRAMSDQFFTPDNPFDWPAYLREQEAIAAPVSCFKQSAIPPTNEFDYGQKIEVHDPRNPTSICIGSVINKHGPRICIRLDGTDNTNDFWEMVDSSNIRPVGTCEKRNELLQPPLGFQKNPSQFPTFLTNTLQGKVKAPDGCFKPAPPSPRGNHFKVDMRLEAVDRKNPAIIAPATIKDVNESEVTIAFDGWHGFDYTTRYDSRELFPVGWCAKAGHLLQAPGGGSPTKKSTKPDTPPKKNDLQKNHQQIEKKVEAKAKPKIEPKAELKGEIHSGSKREATKMETKIEQKVETKSLKVVLPKIKETPPPALRLQSIPPPPVRTTPQAPPQKATAPQKLAAPQKPAAQPKRVQQPPARPNPQAKNEQPIPAKATPKVGNPQVAPPPPKPPRPPQLTPLYPGRIKSPDEWTVDDVIGHMVKADPSLPQPVIDRFREHEIDGKALQSLDIKLMFEYMHIKLGPALKIAKVIESVKKQQQS